MEIEECKVGRLNEIYKTPNNKPQTKEKPINKPKPILMSAPMADAILDGRKTMTRRVVKENLPGLFPGQSFKVEYGKLWKYARREYLCWESEEIAKCPYGKAGDRLWVGEPIKKCMGLWHYLADWACVPNVPTAWAENYNKAITISPHRMPRWASRILLEITNVRIERLQQITTADCRAEGLMHSYGKAKEAFAALINELYGPKTWENNPWVWVIEFKIVE